MGELAVRAVGLAPLVEQGQDLLGFLRAQPVHGRPARSLVGELPAGLACDPAVRASLGQVELTADAAQRPARVEGLTE